MINDGFHHGYGLLRGRTCNRKRLQKSGETHCPSNRPRIKKGDGGISDVRLQITLAISVVLFKNSNPSLQTAVGYFFLPFMLSSFRFIYCMMYKLFFMNAQPAVTLSNLMRIFKLKFFPSVLLIPNNPPCSPAFPSLNVELEL